MRKTMTINQYAREIGVSWKKVERWIERGELRALNVAADKCGKLPRYRITLDAIREFEASRSAGATP